MDKNRLNRMWGVLAHATSLMDWLIIMVFGWFAYTLYSVDISAEPMTNRLILVMMLLICISTMALLRGLMRVQLRE